MKSPFTPNSGRPTLEGGNETTSRDSEHDSKSEQSDTDSSEEYNEKIESDIHSSASDTDDDSYDTTGTSDIRCIKVPNTISPWILRKIITKKNNTSKQKYRQSQIRTTIKPSTTTTPRNKITNPYMTEEQQQKMVDEKKQHKKQQEFDKARKTQTAIGFNITTRKAPNDRPSAPISEDKSQNMTKNLHWGNGMTSEPGNTTRIYFQNINGLRAGNNFDDVNELLLCADGAKISILGFAETNVPWHDIRVKKTVRSKMSNIWNASKLACSAAPMITGDRYYQPGGTSLMVNGEWTSRIIEGNEDESGMGRWSVMRLQGKGTRKLAVLCGYRPVKTEIRTTGASTVYRQQWNHMRALGNENPEPRSQFLKDLKVYIKTLREENHEIILMIDANESTGEKHSHINKFFLECGLEDLHATKHRNLPDPPNTYMRGNKCIDFMAGTPGIISSMERAGIEAFSQTFHSDHRGLFIDINLTDLLAGKPAELGSIPLRGVSGTDPSKIEPYQKGVKKYIIDHNIRQRTKQLTRYDKQDNITNKITSQTR